MNVNYSKIGMYIYPCSNVFRNTQNIPDQLEKCGTNFYTFFSFQ